MNILQEALTQGIAPAIVVVVYLIIVKLLDIKKEKEQAKLNAEFTKSINIISNFLEKITHNIVEKDKEKCRIAVKDAFNSSAMKLSTFVSQTIVNNNIDVNKEAIITNIHNLVNSEFYNIYFTLSLYQYDGIKASDNLDRKWMQHVEKDMTECIFNTNLSKEARITSFYNKININTQSYITYVINKSL
jgi:hypothetical protein